MHLSDSLDRHIIKMFFIFVACEFVFLRPLEFSPARSMAFSLIAAVAGGALLIAFESALRQPRSYDPFTITIRPHWFFILEAFDSALGLDRENLEEVKEKSRKFGENGEIRLTVLSDRLCYLEHEHRFIKSRSFGLAVDLPWMSFESETAYSGSTVVPRFVMVRTTSGSKGEVSVIEFCIEIDAPHPDCSLPEGRKIISFQFPEILLIRYFFLQNHYLTESKKVRSLKDSAKDQFFWKDAMAKWEENLGERGHRRVSPDVSLTRSKSM